MSIETVLFDLDGTILDTNELINYSFEYTFGKFGYTLTKEELMACNGPPLIQTFQNINPELADDMLHTYRTHNNKHHDRLVTLFPNVIETLEQLKKRHKKLGIVTAKMRPGVIQGMNLTNLTPYFDTVVTVSDVKHSKPHPEPVLKAMNALGGKPESTVMIGDNYHDIEAGQRAGVQTAGVAWSSKGKEYLESLNPTYMLDTMEDVLSIVGV